MYHPVVVAKYTNDGCLEWTVGFQSGWEALLHQCPWAFDCEFQVVLQVPNTGGSYLGEFNLLRHQCAVNDNCLPGTRNSNIESAMTTLAIERAKVHGGLTRGVGTKGDGKEDDIPLIPLHVFQILDEQGFMRPGGYGAVKLLVRATPSVQKRLDECLLRLIEGYNTNGEMRL